MATKYYGSEAMDGGITQEPGGEEEEVVATFKRVEELENYGMNKNDIAKLKAGGFHTIEAIAHATVK